jgi:hypothetical protein
MTWVPRRAGAPMDSSVRPSIVQALGALVLVAAVASAVTFIAPDVLRCRGNEQVGRGTALVVWWSPCPWWPVDGLGGTVRPRPGGVAGRSGVSDLQQRVVAVLHSVQPAFLGYVAMLSLAIWSAVAIISQLDVAGVRQWFNRSCRSVASPSTYGCWRRSMPLRGWSKWFGRGQRQTAGFPRWTACPPARCTCRTSRSGSR